MSSFKAPISSRTTTSTGVEGIRNRCRHILVVDGDRISGKMTAFLLHESGYEVTTVHSASAVHRALAQAAYDLVILDVVFLGDDGLKLCRNIRSQLMTPVIIVSARATNVDKIMGLQAGADDYMAKPFHPAELIARVDVALRHGSQAISS